MEIRAYFNFIQRRWKIIIPLFMATLAVTAFLTMRIQPVYEASATYIVRISSSFDEKNSISALNTLISSDDIPATYAKVANSRLIKRQAADQLGLSSSQRSNLTSNSQLIAGTNVIEVTSKGHDPVIVMDYANEVGNQMLNYAATLYGTYELIPLDEATQPRRPISPDIFTNLFLGAILGITLGVVVALMIEYWQTSMQSASSTTTVAAPTQKLIEREQFETEVEKALSTSKITRKPVSVALLEVDTSGAELPEGITAEEFVTDIAQELTSCLQSTDLISLHDDSSLFFCMPDTGEFLANAKMNECINHLEKTIPHLSDQSKVRVRYLTGISSYEGGHEREFTTAQSLLEGAQSKIKPNNHHQVDKRHSEKQVPITTSP